MARFGVFALMPAATLAKLLFREERARAVFAGLAAHSILPLDRPATSAFGLMLGMLAHALGWPIAAGGSQTIATALAGCLKSLGGEIVTGHEVQSLDELAGAPQVLLDVTPRQLLRIGGARLPENYRRQLEAYRYGAGVFKIDYALDGPVPWRAQECLQAGTVHVGGTLEDIVESEAALGPWRPCRAALYYRGAAKPVRPDPRAGWQAYVVGLLPRPERLDSRHDRRDREPDRTVRAGLP